MLSEYEVQVLQRFITVFAKFKLVEFDYDKEGGMRVDAVKARNARHFGVAALALQSLNIGFCFWRIQNSNTNMKVILTFLMNASIGAIGFRLTFMKYHTEMTDLVKNIFMLNSNLGKFLLTFEIIRYLRIIYYY